jgi:DNA-binding NtrC family response regulator
LAQFLESRIFVPKPDSNAPAAPQILIVDDDAGQRSLLSSFLATQGFVTSAASSGEEALAQLHERAFDMMISDVRMNGISGLETLRRARLQNRTLPVLLVTAYADIREAVDAIRDGALNYLAKPIDLDELLAAVQNATGLSQRRAVVPDEKPLPKGIVAQSAAMRALFRDAALVAASDSRVLISGESGVGKEVLADVIHAWSPRATGPFVKVNCAAIPENLLESELFGHEKGAFTGASAARVGRFEQASGGTLFLDEIGELSLPLQAKLLRAIQDGRIHRVGSNHETHVDLRVIAASNRNLEDEVKQGRFREDLFYRLNVIELVVPPLRDRPEDILLLANRFLEEFSRGRCRLSPAVNECLAHYHWPGNVRELRNVIERAALLARGELILPEQLTERVRAGANTPRTSSATLATGEKLEDQEKQVILTALKKHHYNRTETARALGISRRALLYKLQRWKAMGEQIGPPEHNESLM